MVGKITNNKKASASILPAIMGHSPWMTRNGQLKETRAHIAGTAEPWDGNEATDWGNSLEPVVLDKMAERLEIKVKKDITEPMIMEDLPLEASLDGIGMGHGGIIRDDRTNGIYVMTENQEIRLIGPGALESKVTSVRPEEFPAMSRGPLQLQGQMMCANMRWGAIGVLYGGVELRIFLFEPHPGTQQAIREAVADFDRRLYSDPCDYYDIVDSADAVLVYPGDEEDEPVITLDLEVGNLCREHMRLKEGIKDANKALELVTAEIQKQMGNHTKAEVAGYAISWPVKNYKAQPEKIVPAKDGYTQRQKTIAVKEAKK